MSVCHHHRRIKKSYLQQQRWRAVFHARFTALYVQTGAETISADKERLEAHIRYAEESGAEIVMTHGEDVALQIAEYAHLSGVTKIVIGQSSVIKSHFSADVL